MCQQIEHVVERSRMAPQQAIPTAAPVTQPQSEVTETKTNTPKFCQNCGAAAGSGKFCESCGSSL